MNFVVRETVMVEKAEPKSVEPKSVELNMPPGEWFTGEWFPARLMREEQEWNRMFRERRTRIAAKAALYIAGAAGMAAFFALYIATGMWIGGF